MNDDQLADGIRRAFGRYRAVPRPLDELAPAAGAARPSPLLTRRRAFGGLSLVGMGAAVVLAVVLTLGQAPAGQGPSVWAGWQPVPTKPDQAMREQARTLCFSSATGVEPNAVVPGSSLTYGALPLVVQDQRGSLAFFIFGGDTAAVTCGIWRDELGRLQYSVSSIGWPSERLMDRLDTVGGAGFEVHEDGNPTQIRTMVGRTSATRVVILRDDGTMVEATVQDGFFAAWWPGNAQAIRVTAYDGGGTEVGLQTFLPVRPRTEPPGQPPHPAGYSPTAEPPDSAG
ncbi:MAG TPA: hypothetical protein VFC12_01065 [Terriglobales bacterium]|nr:hypothetical protein [Terriglobales bacterium]